MTRRLHFSKRFGAAKHISVKKVTLKRLHCVQISGGESEITRIGVDLAVAAGATGLVYYAASGVATLLSGSVVTRAAIGLFVSVASRVDAIQRAADSYSSDNLYIKINGKKVWPSDEASYKMSVGDVVDIDYVVPLERDMNIDLYDDDFVSGDDLLCTVEISKEIAGVRNLIAIQSPKGAVYYFDIDISH